MNLTIEDKSTVKKIIHIEIPKEDVVKELNKAYGDLKKTATIKGFRKGKIPRKILESRFSKDVHADVTPRMIQETFTEVLAEHKFDVVGSPQLDPPELDPDNAYAFDVTIEVRPEIGEIDFKGMALNKTLYEASGEEVEAQLQMIRKTMSTKETVTEERAVKADDFVLIDYQGFVDGEPYDKTPKIENFVMAIGTDTLPEEFTSKLTGVVPEKELEIDVAYADDDKDENLKGQSVTYKVTLKEIQEEVLPPLDDALVENLGKYENLDALKADIMDNLKKGYERRIDHELSEQIFTTLLENNEFEVPDALVDGELEGIIAETEQAYAQNNTSFEEAGITKEFLGTQYRDVAEKQARRHLILGHIIKQESLDLTDEELEDSFKEMAEGMNTPVENVKAFFKADEKQLDYYKYSQLEKKAVKLIIEQGEITEVPPETEEEAAAKALEAKEGEVKEEKADTTEENDA